MSNQENIDPPAPAVNVNTGKIKLSAVKGVDIFGGISTTTPLEIRQNLNEHSERNGVTMSTSLAVHVALLDAFNSIVPNVIEVPAGYVTIANHASSADRERISADYFTISASGNPFNFASIKDKSKDEKSEYINEAVVIEMLVSLCKLGCAKTWLIYLGICHATRRLSDENLANFFLSQNGMKVTGRSIINVLDLFINYIDENDTALFKAIDDQDNKFLHYHSHAGTSGAVLCQVIDELGMFASYVFSPEVAALAQLAKKRRWVIRIQRMIPDRDLAVAYVYLKTCGRELTEWWSAKRAYDSFPNPEVKRWTAIFKQIITLTTKVEEIDESTSIGELINALSKQVDPGVSAGSEFAEDLATERGLINTAFNAHNANITTELTKFREEKAKRDKDKKFASKVKAYIKMGETPEDANRKAYSDVYGEDNQPEAEEANQDEEEGDDGIDQ